MKYFISYFTVLLLLNGSFFLYCIMTRQAVKTNLITLLLDYYAKDMLGLKVEQETLRELVR